MQPALQFLVRKIRMRRTNNFHNPQPGISQKLILFTGHQGQLKVFRINFIVQINQWTTLDIPGRWDPRTKQQSTGLIAYPAAQGRAVSGCGSQRMLHALERRSHSADHGPSFASLYSPFCRYATSSPDRGKSLLAGGGQLSCNSRTGQIKNPPSECSGSNHIRHSYRMGLATTTTAASGRCREELLGQRPAKRTCRPRHTRMLGAATRGTKKEPTGLFFAACGRLKSVRRGG